MASAPVWLVALVVLFVTMCVSVHSSGAPTSSDDSVIDLTECGSTKACIVAPPGCSPGDCDTILTYTEDTNSDYINFELARQGSGWIGVGFSLSPKMGDDSVISCLRGSDGTMTVGQTLNIGYSNTKIADPDYEGIDNVKVGFNDGQQICRFRRKKVVKGRSDEIYDLNTPYYIMVGTGDTTSDGSSIDLVKHSTDPFVTAEMQDLTVITDVSPFSGPISDTPSAAMEPLDTSSDDSVIDLDECGSTKCCIKAPAGCSSTDCDTIVTYKVNTDPDYINFEMARQGSGWIGVGFSMNQHMGDDSVISCLRAEDGTMTVEQSLDVGHSNSKIAAPDYEGIDYVKVGYNDGQQICRFRRKKVVEGRSDEIYDLTTPYYIMIGTGDTVLDGSSIGKVKHAVTPFVTDEMLDITEVRELSADLSIPLLIKAHGSLAIIAWMLLAGLALLMARHYKKQWSGSQLCGKDVWFSVHVACMALAVLLTIIAVVVIFVHVGGYSDIPPTPAILRAHPITGIIVTVLAIINPIMAWFRPGGNSANRPAFNMAHWGVGKLALILAVITIFLGVSIPTVKLVGQAGYLVYIVIAFVCFYLLVEAILEFHKCKTNLGRGNTYLELKSSDEEKAPPAAESPSSQLFRNIMLVILVVGLLVFGLLCVFILVIS